MGSGVVIAMLDRGILAHHPGWDFVTVGQSRDDDPSDPGYTADCGAPRGEPVWHGLQAAGLAVAETNNGEVFASVAPFARVQPLRVITSCNLQVQDFIDATRWAAGGVGVPLNNPTPARVLVFMGTSPGACPQGVRDAIAFARSHNAVFVAITGNQIPILSNAGIYVPVPGGDGANWATGTSLAAPQGAGVAALMISKNPKLSGINVENRLRLSARPFPVPCSGCGSGIVDADRALRSAEAITTETEPNDDPVVNANYVCAPADVVGALASTSDSDNYSFDLPPDATIKATLTPALTSDSR